jgi:hypothetical protein
MGRSQFQEQTLPPNAPIPGWLAHLDLHSAETWNTASEESQTRKEPPELRLARKTQFAVSVLSSVFAITRTLLGCLPPKWKFTTGAGS